MSYDCSEDILDGSICWNCASRVKRVISTEGLDIRDENNNTLDPEDIPIIELEFCKTLHVELDVVVLECDGFEPKNDNDNDFLKNKDVLK